jgi:hypothetical protein
MLLVDLSLVLEDLDIVQVEESVAVLMAGEMQNTLLEADRILEGRGVSVRVDRRSEDRETSVFMASRAPTAE